MQIYSRLADVNGRFTKTTVALGTFDGVHIGHRRIISRAVELARRNGAASVVFTFSNHPLSIIDPSRCPPLIATPACKTRLIADLGVDALIDLPFDRELLALSPEGFISLLVNNLHPIYLVVGPNYTFGHRGAGSPVMLRAAGSSLGFEVIVPEGVEMDGNLVSSTIIRQCILAGDVAKAANLLGRPFRVSGEVAPGDGRGKGLGFPTANITAAPGQIIPADGVYAVRVCAGGATHRGVANIGANPTFKVSSHRIEVHILDFADDLYGRTIVVDFLGKLRDEKVFDGPGDLKAQIARDISAAQTYFK